MQPPALSITPAASAATPAGSSMRHSAGRRPFVPGLALRGRRRAGARLTMPVTPFYFQLGHVQSTAATHLTTARKSYLTWLITGSELQSGGVVLEASHCECR